MGPVNTFRPLSRSQRQPPLPEVGKGKQPVYETDFASENHSRFARADTPLSFVEETDRPSASQLQSSAPNVRNGDTDATRRSAIRDNRAESNSAQKQDLLPRPEDERHDDHGDSAMTRELDRHTSNVMNIHDKRQHPQSSIRENVASASSQRQVRQRHEQNLHQRSQQQKLNVSQVAVDHAQCSNLIQSYIGSRGDLCREKRATCQCCRGCHKRKEKRLRRREKSRLESRMDSIEQHATNERQERQAELQVTNAKVDHILQSRSKGQLSILGPFPMEGIEYSKKRRAAYIDPTPEAESSSDDVVRAKRRKAAPARYIYDLEVVAMRREMKETKEMQTALLETIRAGNAFTHEKLDGAKLSLEAIREENSKAHSKTQSGLAKTYEEVVSGRADISVIKNGLERGFGPILEWLQRLDPMLEKYGSTFDHRLRTLSNQFFSSIADVASNNVENGRRIIALQEAVENAAKARDADSNQLSDQHTTLTNKLQVIDSHLESLRVNIAAGGNTRDAARVTEELLNAGAANPIVLEAARDITATAEENLQHNLNKSAQTVSEMDKVQEQISRLDLRPDAAAIQAERERLKMKNSELARIVLKQKLTIGELEHQVEVARKAKEYAERSREQMEKTMMQHYETLQTYVDPKEAVELGNSTTPTQAFEEKSTVWNGEDYQTYYPGDKQWGAALHPHSRIEISSVSGVAQTVRDV